MKNIPIIGAVLCLLISGSLPAPAQQGNALITSPGSFGWLTGPYRSRQAAPLDLGNSPRLDALIRAGKLYLSLQDAVDLAIENNLDVEVQRYGPQIAEAALMKAKGGTASMNLDPAFTTSYTTGHQSRPQSNTVTTGLTAVTIDSTGQVYGINKSWLTGTSAALNWTYNKTRSNNPVSDFNPSKSSNIQLQVSQNLLRGFGVAVNKRNISIAENGIRNADLQFQSQLISTVVSVTNLYWDLVSSNEDVKVKQQALALAQKLYEDNRKQVEIGTLAPIEIVSAEAQVAQREQDLVIAQTLLLQQETTLKNVLTRSGVSSPYLSEVSIIPTDRIRIDPVEQIRPIQDLYDTAVSKRPDLEQTKISIENSKLNLEGTKNALLPSLEVTGTLQNNALAGQINTLLLRGQPVKHNADQYFVGGLGTVVSQLTRRSFPDYSLAFSLNIPLRNRAAQADMIQGQLALRQAELNERKSLNQIRVDVQNAVIAVQQARARYQAAEKQRELQEQTLDAEQKKYALGASTVFFVIQYQRDLAQAQSNEVAALSAYAKAKTSLYQVTGETLEINHINFDEALSGRISTPPATLPAP